MNEFAEVSSLTPSRWSKRLPAMLPTVSPTVLVATFLMVFVTSKATATTNKQVENVDTLVAVSTDRAERPMKVNRSTDMGLEIWTEQSPEWMVVTREIEGKPVLLAHTPANVYPPASMSVTSFAELHSQAANFATSAEVALKIGLTQYGVPNHIQNQLTRERKRYGELAGIEVNFRAEVHGSPADVKVFIGKKGNKGQVLLQLYTIPGGMPHLQEHVRRSWNNIKYLE